MAELLQEAGLPDFSSATYKDAYSRINAIVIEGEQEAHDNYIAIGTLIPEQAEELTKLARMELKHMKGFTACAKNLEVEADMPFAKTFFAPLHGNFQTALAEGKITTCLLIQAILIEAFATSAYHIYIPVADPFARKITEGVVKDEYTHLNYGQEWLKANLAEVREELEQANRENLPLVRTMLGIHRRASEHMMANRGEVAEATVRILGAPRAALGNRDRCFPQDRGPRPRRARPGEGALKSGGFDRP